jgi:hypothetical protein
MLVGVRQSLRLSITNQALSDDDVSDSSLDIGLNCSGVKVSGR